MIVPKFNFGFVRQGISPQNRGMSSRWVGFWRLQGIGWTLFVIATLPLKLLVFENLYTACAVTLLRDGTAFLLTLILRQIYLGWNREKISTTGRIAAVLTLSIAAASVETLVASIFQHRFQFIPRHFRSDVFLISIFFFRAMLFAFWSLLYIWIKDWREAQKREQQLIEAESRRREAELRMLRAQVNPHFLFNALNTILAGLNRDQEELKKVVRGLADYLRYSLAHRDTDKVPLGEEFDAMLQYLKVEKGRFRDDLAIESSIDDNVRSISVPGVILQPLVENAVRYGLESPSRPLSIHISARRPQDGWVEIEVANSGEWIQPRGRRADGTGGLGLETLRRRLELLYPERHELRILKESNRVTVSLRIQPESSAVSNS